MTPSIWQLLIVLAIVLLLFGRGKIPQLMGDMAKGIKSFKRGMTDEEKKDDEDEEKDGNRPGRANTGTAPSPGRRCKNDGAARKAPTLVPMQCPRIHDIQHSRFIRFETRRAGAQPP